MERSAVDLPASRSPLSSIPTLEVETTTTTTPTTTTLLRALDLRVQFGPFVALAGVSLELRAGELLGLVGPNGAGKTTLLRALAGLRPADAGAVWVLDKRLGPGEEEAMRHIGFTADEPPLYEAMTVRTFLRFIAAGYGSTGPEVDERIDFWLDKLWLSEKADQLIGALSRGMRQRIGIARTLLPNPAVVLLDEPAAGLDPAGRAQFRELLIALRHQGKALIVSSHILSDLSEYCSHIGIMAKGALVRHGTVAQITGDDADPTRSATYAVRLAAELTPELSALVRALPGVNALLVKGDGKLEIAAAASAVGAAELLARLVNAGLPVCSFAIEGGALEQAYLRSGIGQVD